MVRVYQVLRVVCVDCGSFKQLHDTAPLEETWQTNNRSLVRITGHPWMSKWAEKVRKNPSWKVGPSARVTLFFLRIHNYT
jgi:hypothetical protein